VFNSSHLYFLYAFCILYVSMIKKITDNINFCATQSAKGILQILTETKHKLTILGTAIIFKQKPD